jgi:hypothetical protein
MQLNENEVSDDLLREFLMVALMMGGKFFVEHQSPPDIMDEWLAQNRARADRFEDLESRGFLRRVYIGELDEDDNDLSYYLVTEAGREFVQQEV